jgi:hypothetical protein
LTTSRAQAQLLKFGSGNPNPRLPTQDQPIVVPNAAKPIAQPMQLSATRFSLVNMMPKLHFPGNSIIHGQSIFPTPKNMPGKAYLKQFGYQRPPGIK